MVSFKDLDNFPGLQVPDVDLVVLAARDDPFPARDAEACGDAVLRVHVADVRLEASRGVIIPQADGAVVCGGEDVF